MVRTGRPVILAVDDQPGILELFGLILDGDYDILTASCGATALKTLRSKWVDLILLDLNLPDTTGLDVLGQIRAEGRTVPVILVTVMDRARPAFEALRLGASDYITKPFDGDDLVVRIKRALASATGTGHVEADDRAPRPHMLFVDHDVGVRAALTVSLWRKWRIETSPSVSAAVHELTRSVPDLVVLHVPGRDGNSVSCLATLRRDFPIGPIILITSGEIEPRELRSRGVRSVLESPLDFEALLSELAALLPMAPDPTAARQLTSRTAQTIQRVARGYATVTIASLSRPAGVSEAQLSRSFRTEVGMSLKNFIVRVRIEAAKVLLKETEAKVSDIATTVGLYDTSHLSRMFSRYGCGRPGGFR